MSKRTHDELNADTFEQLGVVSLPTITAERAELSHSHSSTELSNLRATANSESNNVVSSSTSSAVVVMKPAKTDFSINIDDRDPNNFNLNVSFTHANCCSICFEEFSSSAEQRTDNVGATGDVVKMPLLDKICSNHAPWPTLLTAKLEKITELISLISNGNEPNTSVLFRSVCVNCFLASLRAHLQKKSAIVTRGSGENDIEVALRCPLCPVMPLREFEQPIMVQKKVLDHALQMCGSRGQELYLQVETALFQAKMSILFPKICCSVVGCSHEELRAVKIADSALEQSKKKTKMASSYAKRSETTPRPIKYIQFVDCAQHGAQCSLCWEFVGRDADARRTHSTVCSRVPAEFRRMKELDLRRCPRCYAVMERSVGCHSMICRCGHHFDWSKAEVASSKVEVQTAEEEEEEEEEANKVEEEEEEEEGQW